MAGYEPEKHDSSVKYSVVVPLYNEESIVEDLHKRINSATKALGEPYEIVLVNDGSQDETARLLERLAQENDHVVFIDLRRNFGQTAALQAGFDYARGQIIVAMDGDLQHDPYDIPFLVEKINAGYDIASGWRVRRGDNFIMRRLPSWIANWLIAKVSGVRLHDFGTTYKAFRREILKDIRLYGDMHRFIPALCVRLGAKICEVPIKNARRATGKSNYGILRTFRVALDIIALRFATKYMTRPLHLFGKWALISGGIGMGILTYGFIRKLFAWNTFHLFQQHGPLMALGCMLVPTALLFLATGLIGELLMRAYFESTGAKTYAIRRVVRKTEHGGDIPN
ncbi:MAG: glycosyltransferase family 2 protein [Planctomycetes bacterium]|nr:glycosyltransferase family 2 protein [Planctomycetota bacterium]